MFKLAFHEVHAKQTSRGKNHDKFEEKWKYWELLKIKEHYADKSIVSLSKIVNRDNKARDFCFFKGKFRCSFFLPI